jgi:hypothetical protein
MLKGDTRYECLGGGGGEGGGGGRWSCEGMLRPDLNIEAKAASFFLFSRWLFRPSEEMCLACAMLNVLQQNASMSAKMRHLTEQLDRRARLLQRHTCDTTDVT